MRIGATTRMSLRWSGTKRGTKLSETQRTEGTEYPVISGDSTPQNGTRAAHNPKVAALDALRAILGELGLRLKDTKTRIVHLVEGGEGFDFLGFHHRYVPAGPPSPGTSRSSRDGPHARRCSTPATGSGN